MSTLGDPVDCSMTGLPIFHYFREFVQIHVQSQWCHPTISSSAALHFSSCIQLFPASGSFPVSQFFASGGPSIGDSASVLPMNIQGWFLLGLTCLILLVQGTVKSLLQHNLKATILWCSAFFMVLLSHPYMTTGKTVTLTIWTSVSKVIPLLFKNVV